MEAIGGRPAIGSVVAKLQGSPHDVAPPFIDIMQGRPWPVTAPALVFSALPSSHFGPDISSVFERELEAGMKNELARKGEEYRTSLKLQAELSVSRIDDRTRLLSGLDSIRRDVDATGMMDAMDEFTRQAVSILTSGRLAEALI